MCEITALQRGNILVKILHLSSSCIYTLYTVLTLCLQCFDAVGWAAGRASSL